MNLYITYFIFFIGEDMVSEQENETQEITEKTNGRFK